VLLLPVVGFVAGLVGSLLGLGGGVIVVPSLILIGFPVKSAVMLSIFVTIATWSMASEKYLRSKLVDFRVAFVLGLGTSVGAFMGSRILTFLPDRVILILFLTMLGFIGISNLMAKDFGKSEFHIVPVRVVGAFFFMLLAGVMSALLGIGAGVFKVFAMDRILRMPYRMATATSMFLIGITASTSALYYGSMPDFSPRTVAFVAIGTLTGAFLGSRLMLRLPIRILRIIFTFVVILLGLSLLWRM
jgi:uncharacterized membrane protein YfcA